MKRLLISLGFVWAASSMSAQPSPTLQFGLLPNGNLEISWPVQSVYPSAPELVPSYQVEIASSLGQWEPNGPLIRGASFSAPTGRIEISDLQNRPASFIRVGAVLNFAHSAEFIGRTLTNAPLANANFAGADLFAVRLSGSSLANADLSGADLRFAMLEGIDARNANFISARLADSRCAGSDFRGANLLFAEFSAADLSFARFDNADLRGAILQATTNTFTRFHGSRISELTVMDPVTRAIWEIVNQQGAAKNYNGLNLNFSDLTGGDLTGSTLRATDLSGCDLRQADLSGADLASANMRFVDFRGARMNAQTVVAAQWRTIWDIINNPRGGRVHADADLRLGLWIYVNLERADLRNALFNLGIMLAANLNGVFASGANFSGVQISGGDLRNADLRNANFSGAQLENVTLLGANLSGVNFSGARFRNVMMPDGSIRE